MKMFEGTMKKGQKRIEKNSKRVEKFQSSQLMARRCLIFHSAVYRSRIANEEKRLISGKKEELKKTSAVAEPKHGPLKLIWKSGKVVFE